MPDDAADGAAGSVAGYAVVDLDAIETHPLRGEVLRTGTPSTTVVFDGDDLPGTVHLGVRHGTELVAISTWIPNEHDGRPAVQLRGMATAPSHRGCGVGALLLEAGCVRAAQVAPTVWARARDTALGFYLSHGFTVVGDGFTDATTNLGHHVIVRRLA